ncbi:hypothetical protein [Pseudomonas yamanorum]|uniref:hypothetical protein n=1 Tax=Pseudomonas yamanorum TaxID=515393 RepID=UPI003BA06D94
MMDNIHIVLYRTKPLTDRNDIFQLLGRLEGGYPDMPATVLGVCLDGAATCVAYGATLADSDFTIIVHVPDSGLHRLYVLPIYKDAEPRYAYSSQPLEVVVHQDFFIV